MNTIWCICNLSLPFSFFFYRSGHQNTIQFRTLSGGSKLQSMERCYEDGGSSSRRSSYRVPQKSMHHFLINNVVQPFVFPLPNGTFFPGLCICKKRKLSTRSTQHQKPKAKRKHRKI